MSTAAQKVGNLMKPVRKASEEARNELPTLIEEAQSGRPRGCCPWTLGL